MASKLKTFRVQPVLGPVIEVRASFMHNKDGALLAKIGKPGETETVAEWAPGAWHGYSRIDKSTVVKEKTNAP